MEIQAANATTPAEPVVLVQDDSFDLLSYREHPEAIERFMQRNGTAFTMSHIDRLFVENDVLGMLCALGQEIHIETKRNWLAEHLDGQHAVLYFEMALVSLEASPTVETLSQESLFYFHMGIFRLQQDINCYSQADSKVVDQVIQIYLDQLGKICSQYLGSEYRSWLHKASSSVKKWDKQEGIKEYFAGFYERYKRGVEQLSSSLPDPIWIGILTFQGEIVSQEECCQKREAVKSDYQKLFEYLG